MTATPGAPIDTLQATLDAAAPVAATMPAASATAAAAVARGRGMDYLPEGCGGNGPESVRCATVRADGLCGKERRGAPGG
ncbi:MAG: hypothetical protein IPO82_18940 [Betaproteobacteria bacterium]|nr:hypothetical protein [Betaproteobacteria bacterium]